MRLQAKTFIKSIIVLLLGSVVITGCSSMPEPKNDPYNQSDAQRNRSHQTQGELSRETSK